MPGPAKFLGFKMWPNLICNWTAPTYKMNVMLGCRRLKTSDWNHKVFKKLFTEELNQVVSGVIISQIYNQFYI